MKILYRAALLVSLLPAAARAQVRDCTYDRCALHPADSRLLRGDGDQVLVPDVFHDVPAARAEYDRALRYDRPAMLLSWGMTAGLLATSLYSGDDGVPGLRRVRLRVALPVATVALGAGTLLAMRRGGDHMHRAVWLYNRAIPAAPGTAGCPYDLCALRLQGSRLVRGAGGVPVGRPGSPAVDSLFAAAGDSARARYAAFDSTARPLRTMRRIYWAGGLAGLALLASGDEGTRSLALGPWAVAYGAGHLAMYSEGAAADNLARAIWFYNRDLPRP